MVPAVNSQASVRPPQRLPRQPAFAYDLKKCADDTAKNIKLLVEAMTLFKFAMQPMGPPPAWTGAASGIGWGLEFLFKAAAPGIGVVLVAKGLPGAVLGASKTAVIGAAHVTERAVSLTLDGIQHVRSLSPEEEQRLHFTRLLITRMHNTAGGKVEVFRDHPQQLINASIIAVAFLSKETRGSYIKVGNGFLTDEDIAKMSEYQRHLLRDVCEIRDAIRGLLSKDQGWSELIAIVNNYDLVKPSSVVDDDWIVVADQKDSKLAPKEQANLDTSQLEQVRRLLIHASDFSENVAGDEVFKREWAASLPRKNS